MKKIFSLLAAVLFAGSMMAAEVIFTNADFTGQGTANTGSEVTATKSGVTFTCSKGYSADESLRCYAHGELTISASATIEKINFTTTGGKTGGLDAEVEVNATQYHVADLASQARFTEIKVTLAGGAPAAPDTVPATAPAAPKQAEADVMALYSSYYATNNYNFNVLGWGGVETWQTLKLGKDSASVLACKDMKWEIMTNWDANHYDMSDYEKLHADIWVPAAAKVKITFEALGTNDGGSGYKGGVVFNLQKGWNAIDADLAAWNYDFEDMRYLIFEGFETPAGESFEGNPFAFTNIYFWKDPDPITCAEVYDLAKGADVALSPVVVTYANGKNVWVKDETASMLVYLSENATWKAGDLLTGVAGTLDIYNGVHEVKPSADQVAAVVALPGEAPEAEEVIIVTTADVNKYIVMKGVEAEGTFAEGTASNLTINGVTVRNNFKNGYTFEAGKLYDVYGVVTIYQNNPQVYFITAKEAEEKGVASVIEFTAKAAKGVLNDSIFFSDDMLLKLAITDTENKMEIDSNVAVFGDAAAQEIFSYRLKSGGKSSSKNNLKLTVPADGKLVIAARTGSNSETNRTVVVAQGTDTLYNKVVVEADTLDGKIYPFIMVDVKEGDVAVTYPVGSINFYAFAFVAEETPVVADTVVIDAITYGEVSTEDFAEYGAVDVVLTTQPIVGDKIVGDGYIVVLDILPEDANDITGVYSVDSMTLDLDYSGAVQIAGTDTTEIVFVDGTVVFQVLQVAVEKNLAQLAIVGELEAEDGTVFIISAATVVYYEFINEEGIEEIMAENEGKTIKFVQNGQVYILRDNKVYGIRGDRVR